MIALQQKRREKGWSQRELARRSGVDPSYICNAERRGLVLYPCQAERIAVKLDWQGDPADLFKEVEDDELTAA